MRYKGKKVSVHRFKQLVKTRENIRKLMDEMYFAFHPTALKRLKEFMEE
jgi:hypothetical protein